MEKASYLEAVAGKGVLSGSSLVNICRALWSWKGFVFCAGSAGI